MPGIQPPQGPAQERGPRAESQADKSRLTCVVESKEQRAGDGERQDPDNGDHDGHAAFGAVACVVQHRHGHRCVSARAGCGLSLGSRPRDPSLCRTY